jgi:hypothetical protein
MPTDYQDRHRPEPIPSDSIWNPAPATAKPDRATYQETRRAELDRIRLIDIKRRQLLVYFSRGEHSKTESELYLSHRVLVHAVEGYLLGCVKYSDLTGEAALMRAPVPTT